MSLPLILAGCATTREPTGLQRFQFNSPQMGTLFTITLYWRSEPEARAAAQAAFQRISRLDEIMSDYQADSELMELVGHPVNEPVRLSPDLFAVLSQAQRISAASDGAFDVTIGPCVRLWRFSRKRGTLPGPQELATARASVGWRHLHLDAQTRSAILQQPGMRLDLGGIAKGYAADQALAVLKGRGLNRAIVAASGDIAVGDPPPGRQGWRIAIEGFEADAAHKGPVLFLRNAAVSTSGDTEQFVEIAGTRYSHILDPATGLGLTRRIQATVVAPNGTLSDALATTVCILGPERGRQLLRSFPGTSTRIVWKNDAGAGIEAVSPRWARLLEKASARE